MEKLDYESAKDTREREPNSGQIWGDFSTPGRAPAYVLIVLGALSGIAISAIAKFEFEPLPSLMMLGLGIVVTLLIPRCRTFGLGFLIGAAMIFVSICVTRR